MSSIDALLQAAEYIERQERGIRNKWQDLPDELILKILSYSEVKDLISCGQVSKRTRNISQDCSLWMTVNLEKKIVKAELLDMILIKGCKNLNISDSTIIGSLSANIKYLLRVLVFTPSALEVSLSEGVHHFETITLRRIFFDHLNLLMFSPKKKKSGNES